MTDNDEYVPIFYINATTCEQLIILYNKDINNTNCLTPRKYCRHYRRKLLKYKKAIKENASSTEEIIPDGQS